MTSAAATSRVPENRSQRFYRPELDVLRFFAFFAIFILHLPPGGVLFWVRHGAFGPLTLPGALCSLGICGTYGVDLFFALSGYLITTLLLRERETTGDVVIRSFYARRILRIWPLYFFYVALTLVTSILPRELTSAPPFVHVEFPKMDTGCFVAMIAFLVNFAPCLLVQSSMTIHLWTLSIEEQFYLFWPVTLRTLPARRIIIAPIVMLAIAIAGRVLTMIFRFSVPVSANTLTRLDPIAIGILIAILPEVRPRFAVRVLLIVAGLASWFFAAHYCHLPMQESVASTGLGYPATALGSGAFLLAALGAGGSSAGGQIKRATIYLGKISYGLYVYNTVAILGSQIFMFRVLAVWLMRAGWWFPWTAWPIYVLMAFSANVIIAAASYRWLEAPFLRLKDRFATVRSRAV